MKEDGLGTISGRHLVMAIPWDVILLFVFLLQQWALSSSKNK